MSFMPPFTDEELALVKAAVTLYHDTSATRANLAIDGKMGASDERIEECQELCRKAQQVLDKIDAAVLGDG